MSVTHACLLFVDLLKRQCITLQAFGGISLFPQFLLGLMSVVYFKYTLGRQR